MFKKIFDAWQSEMSIFGQSAWFKKLANGELELKHYKGFLRETYHHAGLNPQIQAYATMFLKNNPRDMISLFYKHATSEIGHDLLALNDMSELGMDSAEIQRSKPLPSTVALNAYVLYQIQFVSPIAYLGYLFHLEFLPTQSGDNYINMLKKIGVKDSALSFLKEHSVVDIGHNKLMEKYISNLVVSDKDAADVINCAQNSCHLHLKMITDAFQYGQDHY